MSYQNKIQQREEQEIILNASDRRLFFAVIFLVIIGLMFIFSASAPKCVEMGINQARFLLQQLIGVVVGLVGLKFLEKFNYKKLLAYTLPFTFIVIIMLVLVKIAGTMVNGAQRWINIGPLSLQPSEFSKPAFVLLLSAIFYRNTKVIDKNKIIIAYIPILIMITLIYMQPNLSMIILLASTSVAIFLCAGGSLKWVFSGIVTAVPLLLFKGLRDYQSSRIEMWLKPESDPLGAGYNIIQSKVAFASGSLFGVGYGNSVQKLAWLPEAHTDFIFAVIGEEMGFIGCLLIIWLFWIILQRGFDIANNCQDMYGKLMALGMTFSICLQGFLNIGVSSSFVPATGVPMPFISYGGSSIMVSLWMVGILLNISKYSVKKARFGNDNK